MWIWKPLSSGGALRQYSSPRNLVCSPHSSVSIAPESVAAIADALPPPFDGAAAELGLVLDAAPPFAGVADVEVSDMDTSCPSSLVIVPAHPTLSAQAIKPNRPILRLMTLSSTTR